MFMCPSHSQMAFECIVLKQEGLKLRKTVVVEDGHVR